jgi:hypothetical protein
MVDRFQKTIGPGGPAKEEKAAAGKNDACRCKEVSEMPPRKLLGLMLSDLAFWKKRKRGGPGTSS